MTDHAERPDAAAILPDEVIHQSVRLRIVAALAALPAGARLEFTRLRAITGATDGNLGAHVATLETAGYVAVHKDYVGKRPRTQIALTAAGQAAFARHVAFLRTILSVA